MKIILTTVVLIIAIAVPSFSQDMDSMDIRMHKRLYAVDTSNAAFALSEWKRDWNACLQLRSIKLAEFLVRQYQIVDKKQKEIIWILGKPNSITTRIIGLPGKEMASYIALRYDHDSPCRDGKVIDGSGEGYCWLEILIDPKTKKVMSIGYPCT